MEVFVTDLNQSVSKNFQAQKQLGIGNRNHFSLDQQEAPLDEYQCPQCPSTFRTSTALGQHIRKDHGQGEEIDNFAKALGLCAGMPVTPDTIHQVLSVSEVENAPAIFTIPKGSSSTMSNAMLPGSSTVPAPLFHTTRLVLPTIQASVTDSTREYSRPNDKQITDLELLPPSASGTRYTVSDDVRIIRLKEIEDLKWKEIGEIGEQFPGRDWSALQKRYAAKLKKIVRDRRPDETTIRALEQGRNFTDFTPEEDLQIIKGKEINHFFWSDIANTVTTRTANAIKARYHSYLKGRPQTLIRERSDKGPSPIDTAGSSHAMMDIDRVPDIDDVMKLDEHVGKDGFSQPFDRNPPAVQTLATTVVESNWREIQRANGGPFKKSKRPSKEVIEATIITLSKSYIFQGRPWSLEEDCFLIRAIERDRASGQELRQLFPNRRDTARRRYADYLRKSTVSWLLHYATKIVNLTCCSWIPMLLGPDDSPANK